jgi:hypothetical protein
MRSWRRAEGKELETMASGAGRILGWAGQAGLLFAALGLARPVEAGGPYSFYSVSPCRVADTRWAAGPTGGPALGANATREFPVLGACGLPATAKAVVFNVTIAAPTDYGNLRLYPAGTSMPLASVINWVGTDSALANGAIVPVGLSGANHLAVRCDMVAGSTGTVHLILDVTGYFE